MRNFCGIVLPNCYDFGREPRKGEGVVPRPMRHGDMTTLSLHLSSAQVGTVGITEATAVVSDVISDVIDRAVARVSDVATAAQIQATIRT